MDGSVSLTKPSGPPIFSVIYAEPNHLPKELQKCESITTACEAFCALDMSCPANGTLTILRIDGSLTKVLWRDCKGHYGTEMSESDPEYTIVQRFLNHKFNAKETDHGKENLYHQGF